MTQFTLALKDLAKKKKLPKNSHKDINSYFSSSFQKVKKKKTRRAVNALKKAKKKFRYLTRYKFYNHNLLLLSLMFNSSSNLSKATITIRVESNNIFCSLVVDKKIIKNASSGIYRVSVSLKKQRFASRQLIEIFFYKIRKYLASQDILINVIAPIKIRRLIIKLLPKFKHILFQNKSLRFFTVNVKAKKAFNGCRDKKKVRKKRRRRLVAR
jgi:hypothetical protein